MPLSKQQRKQLAGVWAAAGSAVAAMVAASWYQVIRLGGTAPGGDMVGHAAAAEWLRTLPWWDWRGWSDWFYGGQAIGVNYPPLSHIWMRFTHPAHGQMAAIAVGLLVLLPYGAYRLSRAVGYPPRTQRAAVAAVLALAAVSGGMHWMLSGFHAVNTFYGSWPAMMSTVLGLFCAAWAARCEKPAACGLVAGTAALFNATAIPGVAAVSAALLASSGATFRQSARWAATATCAALAVSAWWLVPFVAGWERLVRFEVPLYEAWRFGGFWAAAVIATIGAGAAAAARIKNSGPARCLCSAALAGLFVTVMADLFGYLRPERWLQISILVAVVAAAGLVSERSGSLPVTPPARPVWVLMSVALLVVFVVVTLRLEALPVAVWLLWKPHRVWWWGGSLAWAAILLVVPFGSLSRAPAAHDPAGTISDVLAASAATDTGGLVYVNSAYRTASHALRECRTVFPPRGIAAQTDGETRTVSGLYQETSASSEFVLAAEADLVASTQRWLSSARPDWAEAWRDTPDTPVDRAAIAQALGARWYYACDTDGVPYATELSGDAITGTEVALLPDERSWHREAVRWWVALSKPAERTEQSPVPVLLPAGNDPVRYPTDRKATGTRVSASQDQLTVNADSEGWVWLRVPWDPYWSASNGTPIAKGGPGHMVLWAEKGTTELSWAVPRSVDLAAVAVTGIAGSAAAALGLANRRYGFLVVRDRRRHVVEAFEQFASTVDRWAVTASRCARRAILKLRGGLRR